MGLRLTSIALVIILAIASLLSGALFQRQQANMADQLVTVALRAAAQTIESELESELEPRGSVNQSSVNQSSVDQSTVDQSTVDQSTVVQSTGNQNAQYSRQKFTLYETLQLQQQLIPDEIYI